MTRQAVSAPGAAAIGPYSHAVWAGKRLYLSGQTPVDPVTGELAPGDIGAQAQQCFRNLFATSVYFPQPLGASVPQICRVEDAKDWNQSMLYLRSEYVKPTAEDDLLDVVWENRVVDPKNHCTPFSL